MRTAAIALFGLLAIAGTASASIYAEVPDAGELPASAQDVSGVGALTGITGSVTAGDADMFRIRISNPAAFSAITSGVQGDTLLFLFNLDGTGIAKNDDISGANFLSEFPVGNPLYAGLPAGDYLIAISGFAYHPFSVAAPTLLSQANFDVNTFTGVLAPQNAGPVLSWFQLSTGPSSGNYSITLTGAEFIPAPSAAALLGLGGLLAARRRR